MSALKNLIRISTVLLLYSGQGRAQILDMSVDFSPLQLSDDFLQSLSDCTPYQGAKNASYKNLEVRTVYNIAGIIDDKCVLKIDGYTNASVHITQTCSLTLDQAKEYSEALKNFQSKKYRPRFDQNNIAKDVDYKKAVRIMKNNKVCRFVRDEIDNTADIRKNLPDCISTESTENIMDSKVIRTINGFYDNKCHFSFKMWQPKPDTSHIAPQILEKAPPIDDITYHYDCEWTPEQIQSYIHILETFALPEEEGYNFHVIERANPWEEINFIINNCKYIYN